MVRERRSFLELRRDPTADLDRFLTIRKSDFESRAREHGVQAFHEFYQSTKFRSDFDQDDDNTICQI
jgi:hypothetical protein